MKHSVFTATLLLLGSLASAQTLTVFAASSLTEAFEEIATVFEAEHSGAKVQLNFDGSATLATQITQGAPADVFASADEDQMQVVVDAGLAASRPGVFATNRLSVITPRNRRVKRLQDLEQPGVLLVLAAPEVPVGKYAREALAKMNRVYGADFSARVLENLVSEELNVRQVALKVELGQADAAIVYQTDAAARNLRTIAVPNALNVVGRYPVVALKSSAQLGLAQAFTALLFSRRGQTVLAKYGFGTPQAVRN